MIDAQREPRPVICRAPRAFHSACVCVHGCLCVCARARARVRVCIYVSGGVLCLCLCLCVCDVAPPSLPPSRPRTDDGARRRRRPRHCTSPRGPTTPPVTPTRRRRSSRACSPSSRHSASARGGVRGRGAPLCRPWSERRAGCRQTGAEPTRRRRKARCNGRAPRLWRGGIGRSSPGLSRSS